MLGLQWSILGSLLVGVVYGQTGLDPALGRLCNAQVSCGDCIFSSPNCVWCADQNYNGTRCYAIGDPDFENLCSGMEQNPMGEITDTVDPPLQDLTQVSPSRVSINVRPGQPQTFNLNVRPARNFPIDLYLLMDLSYSMRDDLDNLKQLGADLAASIVGLSTNFRIGFGSFVEKVVAPFTTLDVRFQQNPCLNRNDIVCEPTYSYRHIISLTDDADEFNDLVQEQMISGNQDLPEGGFDGFLQSLLCTNLIGWRDVSRKLLLYITDAGFHFAGDGKLGGLILPHQSICRLPNSGPHTGSVPVEYMDAELFDYPSVGQIAQALREQDIIPIFAAQRDAREFYDVLAAEIGEGASTGTLASDSSNVVELVRQQYNTISQRVIFDQEPVPGVSVVINPTSCPGGVIEDGICTGLQIERVAEFDVTVSITECTPELLFQEISIPLRVVGFGELEIVLNALCRCECEDTESPNDPACSGSGTLSCGQCVCNPDNFGEFCQCDATNPNAQLDCPAGDSNIQCTGRGTCLCGICDCDPGFFGQACECDERDCINQDSGLLCSGRGSCGCDGRCTCNVEPVSQLPYNGDLNVCECTPNTQNCRDPTNRTSICNGRGACGCDGSCECEDPYFGQFCELCSGSEICFDTNCDSNRDCANCALDIIVQMVETTSVMEFFANAESNPNLPEGSMVSFDSENNAMQVVLPQGQCPLCDAGAVIINGTERADYQIDGEMAVRCEEVRDGCVYRYFVGIAATTDNFTAVHVEYARSCPDQQGGTAPWIIAISIIIPLIVLGLLLLLLLKGLLLLWDVVEVRKFEREIKNAKYTKNENPLYRSATKDYQNPLYGK
uniref:Integrin beta n=1 Tax=Ophlitaspongia tenuis TaxID=61613 RepID=O18482_9METZ|nr:integrin subunit betaPo1 [Ophlitaspongia tenuis]